MSDITQLAPFLDFSVKLKFQIYVQQQYDSK